MALQIHNTHCLFFVKCKCPNGYSVLGWDCTKTKNPQQWEVKLSFENKLQFVIILRFLVSECSRQPTTWNTLDVISNSLSKLPINPEDLPQKIPVWRKICRPVCTPRPNQNTTQLQPTANMDNQMERKIEFWYPLTTPSMVL